MPRFLSARFGLGEARGTLQTESRFPAGTIGALEGRARFAPGPDKQTSSE
jgi:hypothetical protein